MTEMLTMTTAEVADMLGSSERDVRRLGLRGELTPLGIDQTWHSRGRPPMLWLREQVVEYEYEHRSGRERVARLAEVWAALA